MGDNCLLLDQRSTIPSRFEEAIHAVIERTRELNKITLAVIYGQFPWETDSDDAEVQLALILDDDVTDFVATKLELTKTAYDVLVETGIEVAPFPVPVTHWYLPSKAANPSLIEDIRKHGLRINLDRIIARPPPPQVKARPIADIVRILQDVCGICSDHLMFRGFTLCRKTSPITRMTRKPNKPTPIQSKDPSTYWSILAGGQVPSGC